MHEQLFILYRIASPFDLKGNPVKCKSSYNQKHLTPKRLNSPYLFRTYEALRLDWFVAFSSTQDIACSKWYFKALQNIWFHLAVATVLSSPFFISTEEIVSSLGTLTETITNLLTFLTGCYLGVRQFH